MRTPLVSIIIPFYNVENYIEKSLSSALNQTYNNIEIICVNDGSEDKSRDIVKSYISENAKILLLEQDNRGVSAARNRGLDAANGEYYFFLDSDDWLCDNAIEVLIYNALSSRLAVITCGITIVDDLTKEENEYKPNRLCGIIYTNGHNIYTLEPVVWNKLYHHSVFGERRFVEGLLHEDEEMYWQIYSQINKVYSVEDSLVYYRVRRGSITQAQNYDDSYQFYYIKIIDSAFYYCDQSSFRVKLEIKLFAINLLKLMVNKGIPFEDYKLHIEERYSIYGSYFYRKMLKIIAGLSKFHQSVEESIVSFLNNCWIVKI